MNVLALPSSIAEPDLPKAKSKAHEALTTLPVKRVITDYSLGWGRLLAQIAKEEGIAYFGALPYPIEDEEAIPLMDRAKSNIVFNSTVLDYYLKPQIYLTWILDNADIGLAFQPEGVSSLSSRIEVELKRNDKQIYNLYGGYFFHA